MPSFLIHAAVSVSRQCAISFLRARHVMLRAVAINTDEDDMERINGQRGIWATAACGTSCVIKKRKLSDSLALRLRTSGGLIGGQCSTAWLVFLLLNALLQHPPAMVEPSPLHVLKVDNHAWIPGHIPEGLNWLRFLKTGRLEAFTMPEGLFHSLPFVGLVCLGTTGCDSSSVDGSNKAK